MNTSYLRFCPRLKEMIDSGESIDAEGKPVRIEACSTLRNIRVLREIIKDRNCTETLEIGLAYGVSALTILSTLRENADGEYHHSAIDPYQSRQWKGSSLRVIEEEGFRSNFTFFEEVSALVIPHLVERGKQFDLIYIDGSHLFEDVFIDFYYSTSLLATRGILAFDDCTDPHIRKVVKFVRTNYKKILRKIDLSSYEDPEKSWIEKLGNKMGYRQMVAFEKIADPPREWNTRFVPF